MNTIIRYIMAIASLLWWGTAMSQTCTVSMTDANGRQGSTATVQVVLDNPVEVADFQMDLQLPEGVEMHLDILGKASVHGLGTAASHSVTSSQISADTWRIAGVSFAGVAVPAGSGDLLSITLDLNGEPGIYPVSLTGIHLSTPQAVDMTAANARTQVTIMDPVVAVETVTISASELTLESGNVAMLTAQCLPEDATYKAVTWTTSDEAVATVTRGFVTALTPGTAMITATAASGATAQCIVAVTGINPKQISLSPSRLTLAIDATAQIKAIVSPSNAEQSIVWQIDDESVASVDSQGQVTALAEGSAVVTATTSNGLTATAEITVSAHAMSGPASIMLSRSEIELQPGYSAQVDATVYPQAYQSEPLTWLSSDEAVATVADGRITAIAVGEATISAIASNGHMAQCKVTVSPVASSADFSISASAPACLVGNLATLSISLSNVVDAYDMQMSIVLPDGVTPSLDAKGRPALTKSSRLSGHSVSVSYIGNTITVAAVSLSSRPVAGDEGELFSIALQAPAAGLYEILVDNIHISDAYAHDSALSNCQGSLLVQNIEDLDIQSFEINPSELTLYTGDSYKLTYEIWPAEASSQGVRWSVSPDDVATVDADGTIHALRSGTATVTATTAAGYSASCSLTIEDVEAEALALNFSKVNIVLGQEVKLEAIFSPVNTADQSLTWSSSDSKVAEVDSDGTVKALKMGTAIITATHATGLTADCEVSVVYSPAERRFEISVADIEGEGGTDAEIVLMLDNSQPVRSLQCVVTLPETASYRSTGADGYEIEASSRLEGFDIYSSLGGRNLMIMAVSLSGDMLTDMSGELLTLPITLPTRAGKQPLTITDIHLTDYDYRDILLDDYTTSMKVIPPGGYVLGDANKDGVVSVTDIVSIVDYILENDPGDFSEESADVNGDGTISVSDIVDVVEIIMNN